MTSESVLCVVNLERLLKKKRSSNEEKSKIKELFGKIPKAKQQWFMGMYREKLMECIHEDKLHSEKRVGNVDL